MAAKPQVLCGQFDIGPSRLGHLAIAEAIRRNCGVTYFGNSPEMDISVPGMFPFDYAVVCGPSSFENDLEIAILEAAERRDKPAFVIGDTARSVLRPVIKGKMAGAVAFPASPTDVDLAKEFGYLDAEWLGYPAHWEDPNVKPSDVFDRGEYPDAAIRVFVCGLKNATLTDNMLQSVIEAMGQVGGEDYHIYFKGHPSEIGETKDPARRQQLLTQPRVSELRIRDSILAVMKAATFSVLTGRSTGVEEGALVRLSMIYYQDDLARAHVKKQIGEEIWGPIQAGACAVASPEQMAEVILHLLKEEGRQQLYQSQVAAYPEQPSGQNSMREIFNRILGPEKK